MLLSIIIPSFNMGHELVAALESIRNQKFADYEILIVDGCSTDSTTEVVAAATDLPVRFVQESDDGVYDAMNKGIQLSRGEWLYFMGADDLLCDGSLLAVLPSLLDAKLDFLYGDVILSSSSSRYDGSFDLAKLLFEKNICHQAIFYRKRLFDKIGKYNLRYKIWADWDLNIRCFKHPEFFIKYLDLAIAVYNDQSGVSAVYDTVFCRELPSYYLNRIACLESEKAGILNSSSFAIGSKLVRMVRSIGLSRLYRRKN